jgi:hypothetical protein
MVVSAGKGWNTLIIRFGSKTLHKHMKILGRPGSTRDFGGFMHDTVLVSAACHGGCKHALVCIVVL